MKRFIKSTNGAVTVFVTFLLIPAILISGTAVDLTRIYTARSIISNANQMASNTVLSQYNALLHDLYGLFGVAKNDPVFARLLDDYINVTVFGDEGQDTGQGTLQLFYGSNLDLQEVYFPPEKNLRDPDVLARQIEEYMKFRGPVIIVKQFIELLGSSSFKEDAGVIEDKLEIDQAIADMYEKYKQLYDAITSADKCPLVNGGHTEPIGTVSKYLLNIRDEFERLSDCYEKWQEETDAVKKADLEAHYNAMLNNIEVWITGGTLGKNWSGGKWTTTSKPQGLTETIRLAIGRVDDFKPRFDAVVTIARQLDSMQREVMLKIEQLEQRVREENCSEELKDAFLEADPLTDKSLIDTYKEILKWDNIEALAVIYRDSGYYYLDVPYKNLIDSVIYRNKNGGDSPSLDKTQLKNATSVAELALLSGRNIVSDLAAFDNKELSYEMPDGFIKFGEHPGDNEVFFQDLTTMMDAGQGSPVSLFDGQEQSSGADNEKKQRNMIKELLSLVDSAYAGLTNNPLGADYIDTGTPAQEDTDGIEAGDITGSVSEAASHPVADVISNPYGTLARAGDYLLLLTYSTSMFSNYTTSRPQSNNKSSDELSDISFPLSVSGAPISPQVNYFFQSEWEYLYHGSTDASENLSSISRLIYLVRVICNYITVFSVTEVKVVVNLIRTSFSWCPPVGIVLGELARAAFVAAESAVDLATLRAGYKVPLIKSGKNGGWVCSPSGVANALKNIATDAVKDEESEGTGVSYSNYMLFFFLAKGIAGSRASGELLGRTADLIEWNIINYENKLWCDEEKMTQALESESRFKLSDMKTDFCLTTTVDMRMLFLSLGFARNFADTRDVNVPQKLSLSVSEYRGY